MIFNILTVFRELIKPSLKYGVLSKAIKNKNIRVNLFSYSDYLDNNERIDDKQYGGDPGMVIRDHIASKAIKHIKKLNPDTKTIFLSPKGKKLDSTLVNDLSKYKNLSIICGRYEGFDERTIEKHADIEVSIGDFIVSGGETPAIILMDSISRMIDGVIGKQESVKNDSLSNSLLKQPVYTRPANIKGKKVPRLLISGNHKKIQMWKLKMSEKLTKFRRPDLWSKYIKS